MTDSNQRERDILEEAEDVLRGAKEMGEPNSTDGGADWMATLQPIFVGMGTNLALFRKKLVEGGIPEPVADQMTRDASWVHNCKINGITMETPIPPGTWCGGAD